MGPKVAENLHFWSLVLQSGIKSEIKQRELWQECQYTFMNVTHVGTCVFWDGRQQFQADLHHICQEKVFKKMLLKQ